MMLIHSFRHFITSSCGGHDSDDNDNDESSEGWTATVCDSAVESVGLTGFVHLWLVWSDGPNDGRTDAVLLWRHLIDNGQLGYYVPWPLPLLLYCW